MSQVVGLAFVLVGCLAPILFACWCIWRASTQK